MQLGQKVRDSISGFEGIAIAKSEYLHGCVRWGVSATELRDGKPIDAQWFDEGQLEVVADTNHMGKRETTGGPRPEAKRASDPAR
jgi:hypothetical protein